ncbi:MAG: ATP-binding protein [Lentisphaeria bacterium]
MTTETAFAPAERASEAEIRRQHDTLAARPLVRDFLDAVPNLSVILNAARQIVFANRAFCAFLGIKDNGELLGRSYGEVFNCPYASVLGRRPGEAVGCIRSHLTEGGCGTTPFCRTCGAVNAILNSQQRGELDIQECRMICGEEGNNERALDLRIWARPIDVGGEIFTVFSAVDISDEKRRRALERIFFHDVLNTAGGVKGLADLLVRAGLPETEVHELSSMIAEAAGQLIEEIAAQRILAAAETGDLQVTPQELDSLDLLRRVIRQFHAQCADSGKLVQVDTAAEAFKFVSDPQLLRRVLINLVKNALEAVEAGGVVTLGAHAAGGSVCFAVHDAGVMPPEVQTQVFSRSFSTKGHGRGLGTYSIRLISEKYLRGHVSFVSNAAAGTRFTACYPRILPPAGGGAERPA